LCAPALFLDAQKSPSKAARGLSLIARYSTKSLSNYLGNTSNFIGATKVKEIRQALERASFRPAGRTPGLTEFRISFDTDFRLIETFELILIADTYTDGHFQNTAVAPTPMACGPN